MSMLLGSSIVFGTGVPKDGELIDSYCADPTRVQGAAPGLLYRGTALNSNVRSCAAASGFSSIWSFPATGLAGFGSHEPCCDIMVGHVNLLTGNYDESVVDIALPTIGPQVVVGRSYNQMQASTSDGPQGKNWFQNSQPEIRVCVNGGDYDDVIYLITGAGIFSEYRQQYGSDTVFGPVNGAGGIFEIAPGTGGDPDLYTLHDTRGGKTIFIGDNGTDTRAAWQLWKSSDAAGNTMYVGHPTDIDDAINDGYDTAGRVLRVYDAAERYYEYTYSSIDGVQRLVGVVASNKTGGDWHNPSDPPTGVATVAAVLYWYYQSSVLVDDDDDGLPGQLKMATAFLVTNDTQLEWRKTYYRYYASGSGYAGQLKAVVEPGGTHQYGFSDAIDSTSLDTVSDTDLKPYTAAFLTYDSGAADPKKVATGLFNGQCGCTGGGANGTFAFRYEGAPGYSNSSGFYDTEAKFRTIMQRPDGLWITQYFDEAGQSLSKVTTTTDPATSVSTRWVEYVERESLYGAVVEKHSPEVNTGYNHSTGVVTSGSSGFAVYPDVGGGLIYGPRIASGDKSPYPDSPDLNYLTDTEYEEPILNIGSTFVYIPLAVEDRLFHAESHLYYDTSKYYVTAYDRDFWGGSLPLSIVPKTIETINAEVSAGNNGPDSATSRFNHYRQDGTVAFSISEEGVITYTLYDANRLLIKRIDDADPASYSGDFASGEVSTFLGSPSANGGQHLVTEYMYDSQGRLTKTTLPNGRVTENFYSILSFFDQAHMAVRLHFPRVDGTTYYGPVSYQVINPAGKIEFSATLAIPDAGISTGTLAKADWIDHNLSDPIDALDVAFRGTNRELVYRPKVSIYDSSGTRLLETRSYHTIRTSGNWQDNGGGSPSVVCDVTSYDHDGMGRVVRVEDPTGTIDRTVYDAIGRISELWTGTDDTAWSEANGEGINGMGGDMVRVERRRYDGQSQSTTTLVSGKNSHLTSVMTDPDGAWDGMSTDQRETTYAYDYRGRMILQTNPTDGVSPAIPHVLSKYDNMNRMTVMGTYSSAAGLSASSDPSSVATNRLSLSETSYDERGRAWKNVAHKIDDSDGSDDDTLVSQNWYDPVGRVIKTQGQQLTKTRYDSLGRPTHQFVLAKTDDNEDTYGEVYASGQTDVSGDIVLAENQTIYESETGNALFTVSIQRHAGDESTTGELDADSESMGAGDPTTLTATDVNGRVQITAMYYDELDRPEITVQYGTFGIVGDGTTSSTAFTRPSTPLDRSTGSVIVTSTTYSDYGVPIETELPTKGSDPTGTAGAKTRVAHDRALRTITQIANYENGSLATANRDHDIYTRYEYTNGLKSKEWVDIDGDGTEDSDDQVTTYEHAATTSNGSKLNSNRMLSRVVYPPQTAMQADTDRDVLFGYNTLGQEIIKTDQSGVVIAQDYDKAGRLTHRRATTIPSSGYDSFNAAVKRISTTYDSRGFVQKVTQWDNATVGSGSITDEVAYTYDDWGNTETFRQDVNSAVGAGTPDDYKVEFTYAKSAPATGVQAVRRTGQNFYHISSGTAKQVLDYQYLSSAGHLYDDAASRVSQVRIGTGSPVIVSEYTYAGVDWAARTDLPEADIYTSLYAAGAAAGVYNRLDGFNRTISSRWTKDLATDVDFYHTDISYDRNSNITHTIDNIQRKSTTSVHGPHVFDALYTIDDLDRLLRDDQGEISGGSIATRARDHRWMDASGNPALTQTGNWAFERLDINGDGDFIDTVFINPEHSRSRSHNNANEMTAIGAGTPSHNKRGDMFFDGVRHLYINDAFGRLCRVLHEGTGNVVIEYRYNGLGHRIAWHYDADYDADTDGSDPWYYFAYDDRWRMVASFRNADTDPKELFAYHHAGMGGSGSYIDLAILRDRDANSGWLSAADGTLEERRYYCQNWRADVVALLSSVGGQVEQIRYSAYGTPYCIPLGDVNATGLNDPSSDPIIVREWFDTSFYDVRGDIDLDGTVEFSDWSIVYADAQSTHRPKGWGFLTDDTVNNRKGYAGYESDAVAYITPSMQLTWLWHCRNRVYHDRLGSWLRRDPLGYVDGMSLYAYLRSNPLAATDSTGLASPWPPVSPTGPGYIVPATPPTPPFTPIPAPGTIAPRVPGGSPMLYPAHSLCEDTVEAQKCIAACPVTVNAAIDARYAACNAAAAFTRSACIAICPAPGKTGASACRLLCSIGYTSATAICEADYRLQQVRAGITIAQCKASCHAQHQYMVFGKACPPGWRTIVPGIFPPAAPSQPATPTPSSSTCSE